MSTLKVNAIKRYTGTDITIAESGDTVTIPTGAGLTVTDEVKTNKVSPATGVAFTVGDSGDTFTVPSGATLDIVGTISNSGTATGFGAIEWQTGSIKTATFAAVAGKGYFCNTTSGEFDATLPSSPSAGDQIGIADYAGTFDTNTLNVDPNTKKIEGSTSKQGLTAERQAIIIVYVDATQGWIVTEAGDSTTIAAAVITFTTTAGSIGTILDSQRASGYSLSAVTGTVTFGSLTYSISSGSLPAGLSMNSAGAITGTATAVGSDTVSTFTVLATASGGVTLGRIFTIQVDDPIITFTTGAGTLGTIPDGDRDDPPTYGGNLSAATATATSGTVSYAIQSGSIPAGMSLSTSTAAFSGTADAVGSDTVSSFTIRATTTSASEYLDRAFTIQVNTGTDFVSATGPDSAAGVIDGDYKVHTFTATKTGSDGFVVVQPGTGAGSTTLDYLVIAGGAGGGFGHGGGGGSGGYRNSYSSETSGGGGSSETSMTCPAIGNYDVTIGGGGAAITSSGQGADGSDTTLSTTSAITSAGGGGAGYYLGSDVGNDGSDGGCGGGAGGGGGSTGTSGIGGSGTSNQGYDGGDGTDANSNYHIGAGGGGVGAVGADGVGAGGSSGAAGAGGNGLASSITGAAVTRGGGGGGSGEGGGVTVGAGGSGGGGAGGKNPSSGVSGTVNTGSGGGGVDGVTGSGAGGSGIVIIRYKFQ